MIYKTEPVMKRWASPRAESPDQGYVIEFIAKMLRDQGGRETTDEKQDCFERAAKMVEDLK